MDPVRLFTVIALVSLPTVMYGGYALLRLNATGKLTPFQHAYVKAGHAHAGVLLTMSLVVLVILGGRTDLSSGLQWLICLLLLVGVLAQSGGMFVHAFVGRDGQWSPGNTLTVAGAGLLAIALVLVAIGVATA